MLLGTYILNASQPLRASRDPSATFKGASAHLEDGPGGINGVLWDGPGVRHGDLGSIGQGQGPCECEARCHRAPINSIQVNLYMNTPPVKGV